ncbi:uncharacterized protein LOC114538295 [Dendronephthya gigantea]|uniref:uncharacterized protein LOC114538295 n=1 Tax=Dendronephthya gigantea TaxID=151771 RepID=UPI00106CDD69|nr:uncharacterized protein LOC114538295 [Dendronephthya gigantea]
MATAFATKTSGFLAILICFALCGNGFAQCFKDKNQKALCENIKNDLNKCQVLIKDLLQCLIDECKDTSLSSNYDCTYPPKKNISGYNATRLDKSLKIEDFLQEILKRIVVHQIYNHKIRRHFKTVKCYAKTKLVGPQLNLMMTWMNIIQKGLGFSTATQISSPPKLTSTGAKSKKDWYYVRVQMLINLNHDIADIQGYFNKRHCIIPKCSTTSK